MIVRYQTNKIVYELAPHIRVGLLQSKSQVLSHSLQVIHSNLKATSMIRLWMKSIAML